MDPDRRSSTGPTIQVWRIPLGAAGSPPPAVSDVLDDAERARLDALRSADERAAYAATHVALRQILGRAIGATAAAVAIERAPCARCGALHGKPRLAGRSAVRFNLSRRGDLALVALSAVGEVGVDVETAAAAASLAESADLFAGPDDGTSDERDLLRLWTRKEAVLKATGTGLTADPLTVAIALDAEAGGWRRATVVGSGAWWVADVALGPAHVGAVACAEPGATIALRTWPPT